MAMMATVTADMAVAARFRDVATSMPDTLALVAPHARYTYSDIDRWSDAIAADIVALASPAEPPVAIVMRDPVIVVPVILAVTKAGHSFVLIDGSDPDERVGALLDAAGAVCCIVDAVAHDATRKRTVLQAGAFRQASMTVSDRPSNEMLQFIFTSGTTGAPKAVVWRQRSYVERVVHASSRSGRAAGARVTYTALPGYARASAEIFGALLNGATLFAFDARNERLDALASLIERERITTLKLTPALFRRFMRTLPADTDLSSVRKLGIGADVLTLADVDAWRARFPSTTTLERAYSCTEAGNVLHVSIRHDTPVPGPLVPMGRPVPGVDVWVIDEDGNTLPDEMTGELVIRSRHVAHGYWNAPELTEERFTFDDPEVRTFRTGDLVRRDVDGLYYFIGRRDARLKIHGRRIDPVELESALIAHAGVREAVVLGEPGPDGELQLAAWVVSGDSAATSPHEIRTAMRGNVPAWMIPSRIHLIDALPMTPAAKVDRAELSQRAVESSFDDFEPGVGGEHTLRAIWSRVLGATVEVDDDFFEDLGGSSLDALEIVTKVSRVTGRSLPLSLLLELNTVRKMSGYLDAQPDMDRTVIALQSGGSMPPLFCVSGKGGSVIVFRTLADALGSDQPFFGITHHGIDPRSLPTTLAALAACYADAIRERQPEGPYYLAGYSAGGFVAWEIARQLSHSGYVVAFVGLFDTAASSQRNPAWKRYGKYVSLVRRRPVSSLARFTQAVGRRVVWAARWAMSGGTRPFVPEIEANRFFDSLILSQSLQPYAGPVTVFLAREGRGGDCALPDAGWQSLCEGDLSIIEIDGTHDTILNLDAAGLAQGLSRALAEARARVAVQSIDTGFGHPHSSDSE